MTTKRAISIKQPWGEQNLRGIKKKEYRSRPTRIRERVYLYASRTPADSPSGWRRVKKEPGQLPVGKIVGTVEVVDCREEPAESRLVASAFLVRESLPMGATPRGR